jgi:unsaturated rhamnogalacturonyl hydrolase
MNRRHFFYNSVLLGGGAGILQAADPKSTKSLADAKTRIAKAAAAALAMQRRDWEQGILAQAFLEAGDEKTVILLTKAAIVQRVPDGRLAVVGSGSPTDPAMGGEAYWRAGQLTGDVQIQEAARGLLDFILKQAPRAEDGTLYHVFRKPEVWSDGFNGAPPFLAATGNYDEALKQIEGFRKRLWNPEKKLLSHIVDDTKPDARKDFWGGGNGWAAAGLARVIRSLPENRKEDRARLAAFVKDIVDGCLAYQRPDGLFHNSLDRPDTFVETNLAQMLAFAIYTGVLGGWLPQQYIVQADRMRTAARAKMDAFGYVQDVCGAPSFDRAGTATEGQAFCIMMEAAGMKYDAKRGRSG